MTRSTRTISTMIDLLFKAAERKLENKAGYLFEFPNLSADKIRKAEKEYLSEIRVLNGLVPYLVGKGMKLKTVHPETAYKEIYDRLIMRYEPE